MLSPLSPAAAAKALPLAQEMPAGIDWQQLAALPVLREFYRLIRRLFGMDIVLINPDGRHWSMLGRGRGKNPFCRAIQRRKGGMSRCLACDVEHVAEAGRTRRPLRYRCHAGLTEFIIPIMVNRDIIAHLQCGQVLNRPSTPGDWARACRKLDWIRGDKRALARAYRGTKVISNVTQEDLVALLQLLAQHAATAHARLLLLEQHPQDRVISRALAFLKNRFREDITLGQVAAAAGTSRRNLVRILRARTSATVLDHLHRLRIDHACEQLRTTHEKIGAVGLECGFGSIQQFNRVFRKMMGATPGRWRARGLAARNSQNPL